MAGQPSPHVRESITQISSSSWLIGKHILLTHSSSPNEAGPSWGDGDGSFYNITEVSDTALETGQLPASVESQKIDDHDGVSETKQLPGPHGFRQIYDAPGGRAVWAIGEAVCKVQLRDDPGTKEHTTLEYLWKTCMPLSFKIPELYYHAEHDDRYYIFQSRMPGDTLMKAWPSMDEATRDQAAFRMADICEELSKWQSNQITGVDGNYLSDRFLLQRRGDLVFTSQKLISHAKELGMDCSTFFFYHCDLGPGNIIVDSKGAISAIIDWETAGFVPKEWIRTKFRISSGLDVEGDDIYARGAWRKRVELELERRNYSDVAVAWMDWLTKSEKTS